MKNANQELAEIKSMMEKSTRFLSLSGIAGIPVGIIALVGTMAINYVINNSWKNWHFPAPLSLEQHQLFAIITIALSTFLMALVTTWYLSKRKISASNTGSIYSPASLRFVKTLAFSISIGALVCASLAWNKDYQYILGISLVFYGIGMSQASDHGFKELKYLGLGCILAGILALVSPSLSIILWGLGFGLLHVLYGVLMHRKYDN